VRLVAATLLGILIGGCASPTVTPTVTPTPSAAQPSPTLPPTAAPSLAICRTKDVSATASSWGAAGGTTYVPITVSLVGASPCLLLGDPEVGLLDHKGHVLAGTPIASHIGMQDALELDATATLNVGWSSWCGAPPPQPLSVRVELYGGESLTVPLPVGFAASCQGVASALSGEFTTP